MKTQMLGLVIGLALLSMVLARVVADRHPEVDLRAHGLAIMMSANSELFERVREGGYKRRRRRGS